MFTFLNFKRSSLYIFLNDLINFRKKIYKNYIKSVIYIKTGIFLNQILLFSRNSENIRSRALYISNICICIYLYYINYQIFFDKYWTICRTYRF